MDVDQTAFPYGNSRRLVTAADVKGDAKRAHNASIPGNTAVKVSGKYLHEDVWRYLFTHPVEQVGMPVPPDPDLWLDQRKPRAK